MPWRSHGRLLRASCEGLRTRPRNRVPLRRRVPSAAGLWSIRRQASHPALDGSARSCVSPFPGFWSCSWRVGNVWITSGLGPRTPSGGPCAQSASCRYTRLVSGYVAKKERHRPHAVPVENVWKTLSAPGRRPAQAAAKLRGRCGPSVHSFVLRRRCPEARGPCPHVGPCPRAEQGAAIAA
jgi:hypothetical protein